MLALARLEQMQVPEAVQEIDAAELLHRAIASRAALADAHRLQLRGSERTPHVLLRGDPFLLQQALGNLLDNAIDFSPTGGNIELSIEANDAEIVFAVRDDGPGAPDYALPRLFERFYSLPRPATGRKSTGLGLAFVREVARLHGGTADFANPAGGSALARIVLPARPTPRWPG